jgi:hypothetical protein
MLEEMGLGLRLVELDADLEDLETRLEGLEPRTDDLELRLDDLDLGRETRLESRTELLRRDEFKDGLGDRLVARLEGELLRRTAGDFAGSGSGPESESELNLSRLFLFDDAGVACDVDDLPFLFPPASESESESVSMNSLLVGAFSAEFLIVASLASDLLAVSSSELSRKLALAFAFDIFFDFPAEPDFGLALTKLSSSSEVSESSRSESRFSFSSSPDKSLSTFLSFRCAFGVFRTFSVDFFGSDFFPLFDFVADPGCARAGNI